MSNDPSAPAPAPSVAPDAAVEAGARRTRVWLLGLGTLTLAQVDDLAPQIARAALTAALPLLTAAPSATRDEVADVLVMTRLSDYAGTDMAVIDHAADALLARFNITPRAGR